MTRLIVARLWPEWRDLRIVDASSARGVPGLAAIAARVEAGVLAPTAAVVVGRHPLDGGWPDAIVACPIPEATARLVLRGDPVALADCLEILEDALALFRGQLRSGRLN